MASKASLIVLLFKVHWFRISSAIMRCLGLIVLIGIQRLDVLTLLWILIQVDGKVQSLHSHKLKVIFMICGHVLGHLIRSVRGDYTHR